MRDDPDLAGVCPPWSLEEQSAALAERCFAEAGANGSLAATVARLVMATKSHEVGADSDAGLIVDVALSMLGQGERRFSEYAQQIRQEYAWVPHAVFALKRAKILHRFLARERIFVTEWFRNKYERQARQNLEVSISKLRELSR